MQERAARTRRTLVKAAACEFDRHGYAGSSLTRIARTAGISTGAVTFHFPNKEELAEVVRAQGHAATLAAVARVRACQEDPLRSVVTLTLTLARLLEDEASVRAAARLTREQPGCGPRWTGAWVPVVRERLRPLDEGPDGGDGATLTALAVHLVAGVECDARSRAGRPEVPGGRPAARLARIWDLVLRGYDRA
ncbi:TetR family transcriptional regulator [Streptomyces sp. NPDC093225]|uniref:TetR family transcriptional regulator n=1 Tax=Streptomyces sp. NPDC093225 TaxID=3366034 RepID=UPI00382EF25B